MGNFDRGSRGFGGRGGGRDSGERKMYRATCEKCNKGCEVPFRPDGRKPVYCSDCFKREERPAGSGGFGRRDFGRDSGRDSGRRSFGGDKQMFQATCGKCGDRCEVPFRPSGDRPVYCSACFSKDDGGSRPEGRNSREDRGNGGKLPADAYMEQFTMINEKLDLILDAIYFDEDEAESEAVVIEGDEKKESKKDKKGKKKGENKDEKKAEIVPEAKPVEAKAEKAVKADKKSAKAKPAKKESKKAPAKKAPAKKK